MKLVSLDLVKVHVKFVQDETHVLKHFGNEFKRRIKRSSPVYITVVTQEQTIISKPRAREYLWHSLNDSIWKLVPDKQNRPLHESSETTGGPQSVFGMKQVPSLATRSVFTLCHSFVVSFYYLSLVLLRLFFLCFLLFPCFPIYVYSLSCSFVLLFLLLIFHSFIFHS
jgi:hypothetical protein